MKRGQFQNPELRVKIWWPVGTGDWELGLGLDNKLIQTLSYKFSKI